MEKIDINGIRLAYQRIGNGDKNLIFLHGNGENHTIFAKLVTRFPVKEYTCYLIDTRGHGGSEFGEPYTIEQFGQDIIEFIERLGLKKVNVVGFSDGANIAMSMAKERQDLLEKMVLISGNFDKNALNIGFRVVVWLMYILSLPFSFKGRFKKFNLTQKLMLKDFGVNEKSLAKILTPTLVIGAETDIILHQHTELIGDSLPNGITIFSAKTTHFNIVEDEHTLEETQKFITKPFA